MYQIYFYIQLILKKLYNAIFNYLWKMYLLKIQVFIAQQCTDSNKHAWIQIKAAKLILARRKILEKVFQMFLFKKL